MQLLDTFQAPNTAGYTRWTPWDKNRTEGKAKVVAAGGGMESNAALVI